MYENLHCAMTRIRMVTIFLAGDWRVWIQTIDTAIHGSVAVVAYGDQGSSGPISLGKTQEKGLFIAGHMDEFKVHCLY